jgi:hypothetical protein
MTGKPNTAELRQALILVTATAIGLPPVINDPGAALTTRFSDDSRVKKLAQYIVDEFN